MQLFIRLLALLALCLSPVACKEPAQQQQKQQKPGGASNDGLGTGSNDPFGSGTDPFGNTDDDKDDDCFDLTGKSSFNLTTSDYTYEDDIEEILDEYCLSCHSSDKYGDLSSYTKAKGFADEIAKEVDRGDMPPEDSDQMTSSQRRKLLDWAENGAPRDKSDQDEDEDNDRDEDDRDDERDDCRDDEDEDEDEGDDRDDDRDEDDDITDLDGGWEELLAADEVEKCEDKGKIYDRTEKECHKADIAESYKCTDSGIKDAFKEIGIDVTGALEDMDDDGFKLDQCGEDDGDPIVFFIKKTEDDDTIGLKVRKLCKKGSSVCD